MEKHNDGKGELLSRDEMKSTKGGAGIPTATVTAIPTAAELKKELGSLDRSLQAEAVSTKLPSAAQIPTAPPLPKV
jgi:hypothetical protein